MTDKRKEKTDGRRVDPQLKKIPVGYKLPRWMVLDMRARGRPAAVMLEEAYCKVFDVEPPEVVKND